MMQLKEGKEEEYRASHNEVSLAGVGCDGIGCLRLREPLTATRTWRVCRDSGPS